MRYLFLIVFGLSVQYSLSATQNVRLTIQAGTISLSGAALDALTFSENVSFQSNSDLFIWTTNDDVNLKVVNLDSEPHGFEIEGYVSSFGVIAPGDSSEQNIVLSTSGVFRYFDNLNQPYNEYLGLSGVIHIKDASDATPYFYWDLREYEESWNAQVLAGSNPTLNTYDPEQFYN